MTKNPYINALAAFAYIGLVALLMFNGQRLIGPDDTIFAPIAMISLLTLSTAVMGYIFFYIPFGLYFDGQKKDALNLFLRTLASFAVITVIAFISLFIFNHK